MSRNPNRNLRLQSELMARLRGRAVRPLLSRNKRLRNFTNPTNVSKPNHKPHTTTLLSLPDGPISQIFIFLKATDHSRLFYGPRHAFALALTCKRLLHIFGTLLTRIVPDLEEGRKHDLYPTFRRRHMFNVIMLARCSLREINLTRGCLPILRHLPEFCPRVERISLQDFPDEWDCEEDITEIEEIQLLPLQSLSIHTPSSLTLILISEIPQELSLIDVHPSTAMFLACQQLLLLRSPPKKFCIQFRRNSRLNHDFRALLSMICPLIQDFSLVYKDECDLVPPVTEFLTSLENPRGNIHSNCRKMQLRGDVFEFVQYAHPLAHVEISRGGQTFIDCADGIYPTQITLHSQYLNHDLSRVSEIVIAHPMSIDWESKLRNLRFKSVRVKVDYATNLDWVNLKADVVEVPSKFLIGADWLDVFDPVGALRDAKEVRVLGTWRMHDSSKFFASVARLLDMSTGKVVFLEYQPRHVIAGRDIILRALVTFISNAVDKFEARGGDASTVRAIIDAMNLSW